MSAFLGCDVSSRLLLPVGRKHGVGREASELEDYTPLHDVVNEPFMVEVRIDVIVRRITIAIIPGKALLRHESVLARRRDPLIDYSRLWVKRLNSSSPRAFTGVSKHLSSVQSKWHHV